MALPAFNADGDSPPGVHHASMNEVLGRFGGGGAQRVSVATRLTRIYELGVATGHLARFVVFGSFITDEMHRNDVDVVMLMDDTFDLGTLSGEAALIFDHAEADAYFGASIFWLRRSGAIGGEEAMIEYWQTRQMAENVGLSK